MENLRGFWGRRQNVSAGNNHARQRQEAGWGSACKSSGETIIITPEPLPSRKPTDEELQKQDQKQELRKH